MQENHLTKNSLLFFTKNVSPLIINDLEINKNYFSTLSSICLADKHASLR